MIDQHTPIEAQANRDFRDLLTALGDWDVQSRSDRPSKLGDLVLSATSLGQRLTFVVEAKRRITPQTAVELCQRMRAKHQDAIPVIYAPVISPRVATIAKQHGVGYFDEAGNCWLRSNDQCFLIERQGRVGPRTERKSADLFSPRSSRVVRAMLANPEKGWKLNELAAHPEVAVSLGLASRIKHVLLEQAYVVEDSRLLYLADPVGLLQHWSMQYRGPVEQSAFYFRGTPDQAESAVLQWCSQHQAQCALAGLSAAWILEPEVRRHVTSIYIDEQAFASCGAAEFASAGIGRRVDSGANLLIWRPYDRAVFAACQKLDGTALPVTSALQTYLDLQQAPGRGAEAAQAIFDQRLRPTLEAAAATQRRV